MRNIAFASISFYVAGCLTALVLAVLKTAILFYPAFWRFLPLWISCDAGQFVLGGLLIAPLFALYFAWIKPQARSVREFLRIGSWCGFSTYLLAYGLSVLASIHWSYAANINAWSLPMLALFLCPLLMLWLGKYARRS